MMHPTGERPELPSPDGTHAKTTMLESPGPGTYEMRRPVSGGADPGWSFGGRLDAVTMPTAALGARHLSLPRTAIEGESREVTPWRN